jgi:hypothetical protein
VAIETITVLQAGERGQIAREQKKDCHQNKSDKNFGSVADHAS